MKTIIIVALPDRDTIEKLTTSYNRQRTNIQGQPVVVFKHKYAIIVGTKFKSN